MLLTLTRGFNVAAIQMNIDAGDALVRACTSAYDDKLYKLLPREHSYVSLRREFTIRL